MRLRGCVGACVRAWLAGGGQCGLAGKHVCSCWLSHTQSTSVETLYKQCRVQLNGSEVGCIMVNHWTLNTKDQMVSDTTYLTGLLSSPPCLLSNQTPWLHACSKRVVLGLEAQGRSEGECRV